MQRVGLDRRSLWRQYLRALEQSKPSLFIMENVPQLLQAPEYQTFVQAAEQLGFSVEGRILNAASFGVARRRRRAIVIGSIGAPPLWPSERFHPPDAIPLEGRPWKTFREAVEGLSLIPDGDNWHSPRNPPAGEP